MSFLLESKRGQKANNLRTMVQNQEENLDVCKGRSRGPNILSRHQGRFERRRPARSRIWQQFRRALKHIYFSATLEAATWGAELAKGEGRERIYIVEPTGAFEDDPNLTDKKFPGNITASYRSTSPLRVIGELKEWTGHSAEQVQAMRDGLALLEAEGKAHIEE